MPQLFDVEGIGRVSFPDDATPDEVANYFNDNPIPRPSISRNALAEGLTGFAGGAVGMLGSGLRQAGRMNERLAQTLEQGGPINQLVAPMVRQQALRTGAAGELVGAAEESDTLRRGTGAGFGTSVMEGFGQVVPALGSAFVVGPAGPFALAFGAEADSAYNREIERQKREEAAVDPDLALAKSLKYGTVSGLIESTLGAGRLARQLGRALSGELTRDLALRGVSPQLIRNITGSSLKESGVGAGQEGLQRVAEDIIVEGETDLAGPTSEAAVGGIVQGLLRVISSSPKRLSLPGAAMFPRRR